MAKIRPTYSMGPIAPKKHGQAPGTYTPAGRDARPHSEHYITPHKLYLKGPDSGGDSGDGGGQ